MKNPHRRQDLSAVMGLFQDLLARLRVLTPPRALAPVPVPVTRRSASGMTRRTPPSRPTGWISLLAMFVLLSAMPAWAAPPALPAGVPNIYDPMVRAHFHPVGVGNLGANPDFPVVLLVNTAGEQPEALLLGLDARNGKDTWSLTTDPIILIVVFSDVTTIRGLYVDTGFADRGKASGSFAAADEVNFPALPDLFKAAPGAGTRTYI